MTRFHSRESLHKRVKKNPIDGWEKHHRFPFLFPGASFSPGVSERSHKPEPPHRKTESDTSERGGEGFQTPTSFTCPLLFSSVILREAPKRIRKKHRRVDREGMSRAGVLKSTPSLHVCSTKRTARRKAKTPVRCLSVSGLHRSAGESSQAIGIFNFGKMREGKRARQREKERWEGGRQSQESGSSYSKNTKSERQQIEASVR